MSSRPTDDRNLHENGEEGDISSLALTRTSSVIVAESDALPQAIPTLTPHTLVADAPQESWIPIRYRILLCAFLTSMSFGVTQVPMLYVFRLMTCDAYYKDRTNSSLDRIVQFSKRLVFFMSSHDGQILSAIRYNEIGKLDGHDDRCSLHAIESSTALAVSLLGASTTVFGILNLFLTGGLIKRIGVQRTLLIQVFFPAVRLLIQNIGIEVWGSIGILIVQCSQVAVIIGGPSGYILALNQFITDVVTYEQRTAELGRLSGTMLFGSAVGFLMGGVLADVFSIKTPFRVTLALFLGSTLYVMFFLPNSVPISPGMESDSSTETSLSEHDRKRQGKSKNSFFGPLLVFAPRRFVLKTGATRIEYGAFLLAWGVFLGVLSTGYLTTLLQLYSTDVFDFGTQQNGWLIFMYSSLRGVFLTFAFPKLIDIGRAYMARRDISHRHAENGSGATGTQDEREPLLSSQAEPTIPIEKQVYKFDLVYTRFSIAADGILTLLCSFLRQGWQMYLVAAILPFAAGTGSAAKGTVLQMVGATASSDERTDALAGISLVDSMARLTTTFAFGLVFAGFTNLGRPELVFTVNALCALIAFVVLLFAHFPPEGAHQLEDTDESLTGEIPA